MLRCLKGALSKTATQNMKPLEERTRLLRDSQQADELISLNVVDKLPFWIIHACARSASRTTLSVAVPGRDQQPGVGVDESSLGRPAGRGGWSQRVTDATTCCYKGLCSSLTLQIRVVANIYKFFQRTLKYKSNVKQDFILRGSSLKLFFRKLLIKII